MTAVLDFLTKAAAIVPQLITIGEAGYEAGGKIISMMKAVHDRGSVTDADWDALHAIQDANTAILDAPMQGE